MEAIVLAGGLGTRLRSVVGDVPKPMAAVRGRPFLAFVLDQLADAGFAAAVLAVGYRHESISSHFGDRYRDMVLRYSVEREPLGTGGAIRLACSKTSAPALFVLNGDTFVDVDHRAMKDAHECRHADLTMAICHVPDVARYGALDLSDTTVEAFREKGPHESGWINAGVYCIGPGLRARFPPEPAFSFEQDVLVPHVRSIRPQAFPATGIFIDIGVPEDYARAQTLLAAKHR